MNNGLNEPSGLKGDTIVTIARKREATQYNTVKLCQPRPNIGQRPCIEIQRVKKLCICFRQDSPGVNMRKVLPTPDLLRSKTGVRDLTPPKLAYAI